MVRTKADAACTRVSGAKAPRKVHANSVSTETKGHGSSGGGGGNPYCPRETPGWQKEITKFFTLMPNRNEDAEGSDATISCKNMEVMDHNETNGTLQKLNDKDKAKEDKEIASSNENRGGDAASEVPA